MIELVQQTLNFYIQNKKVPSNTDIKISDSSLFSRKWTIFVTIYRSGEIVWSSGNIKPLESSVALELIANTIAALNDEKARSLTPNDIPNIKVRIDEIASRKVLSKQITDLDPSKLWVLTIKKDYSKLVVVLPNISADIKTWLDLYEATKSKLWDDFKEEDYITYELETNNINNL